MSKKLLMNKFSNNGLMPTQDGLVCWLDAFDLITYALNTVWLDRTTNGNNGMVTFLGGEAISLGNGYLDAKSTVHIPNPTKGLIDYTVEIGYQDTSIRYWLGLWGNTSKSDSTNPDGVSFYQSENIIKTYPFSMNPPDYEGLRGGTNYITFTFNSIGFSIYINGTLYTSVNYTTSSRINPSKANYFCFMSRKVNVVDENTKTGADFLYKRWYYLRIYNRVLTEEEILNNYNYELSLQRGI